MFSLHNFPLNFQRDSLSPYISKESIDFHYDKHFNNYINTLNSLIQNTEFENLSLEEIIIKSKNNSNTKKIFNNAAQVYNHNFFFNCLSKDSKQDIPIEIINFFKSKENFLSEFKQNATELFGSGWVWLIQKEDKSFEILKTENAENPLTKNLQPVLNLDVWEHSYYLDYQNRRSDYTDSFLSNCINWNFVKNNIH